MTRKRRQGVSARMRRQSWLTTINYRYGLKPGVLAVHVILLLGLFALGLYLKWQAFEYGMTLSEMNDSLVQLTKENKFLEIEYGGLISQSRLEQKAKEYKLFAPEPWQKRTD